MKKLLVLLICGFTICSCSNPSAGNSNFIDTTSTKDNLISQTDTPKIQINSSFPFGCADLTKYKYPKRWEGDLENYGQLKQPKGKEFDDIGQCFELINSSKTIGSPTLKHLELLKIGDNFKNTLYLDTLLQKSTDSCRYRLPNIGIYECYYSYQQDTKPNSFGMYGNLLLLDPTNKQGKLVNVYFQGSGEQHLFYRYFFINNNVISIYEGYCYDDGCSLDEKFKITISQNGELKTESVAK